MNKTNKKLKIGFFTDTYKPQINGVVSSVESFRLELEKQGHKVYVYCPKIKNEKSGKKIIRFRSVKFFFQPEYYISLPFSRKAIEYLWQNDLDIVHAHTPFSLGQLGYYYSVIKKVPFIHTYHTLYPEYVKTYIMKGKVLTPQMVKKLSAAFSNRCDLTIAPSEKIKKLLRSYGAENPIKVLPTGLDLEEFKTVKKNNFRKKYSINENDKVLIYVGRLAKEKNIAFLIKAMAELKKTDNIKLLLVGDGPDTENLKILTKKLNLQKEIIFTGYFTKKQAIKAYQASDLFVFASKTDTQGMVILEALACGLPVVAIKDLAFTTMVRQGINGFLVRENKKIFARQVLTILNDKKLYNKMATNALKIAQEFSIDKIINQLISYYNQLIK
jgi:glycosyltransferase involved in cell wall biosynthesis